MKRAEPRGLQRNAAVALGHVGSGDDVDVLTCALGNAELLVREHAARASRGPGIAPDERSRRAGVRLRRARPR